MGIEENYFINVDISEEDTSVVLVYKECGSKLKVANTFTGKDAEKLHNILIGKEKLK